MLNSILVNLRIQDMNPKDVFITEAKDLEPEMRRYMDCMDEVKNRWVYIRKSLQTNYSKVEIEHICLHFRMITESILLANLSSHEGYYFKTLHDLAGMWNIHDIIKTISHVNPNYYPLTIKTEHVQIENRPDATGYIHFSNASLTKDGLIKIHSSCSEYLHPQNPFAISKDYTVLQYFEDWLVQIKELLTYHSIKLAGGGNRSLLVEIDFNKPYGAADDIKIGYLRGND